MCPKAPHMVVLALPLLVGGRHCDFHYILFSSIQQIFSSVAVFAPCLLWRRKPLTQPWYQDQARWCKLRRGRRYPCRATARPSLAVPAVPRCWNERSSATPAGFLMARPPRGHGVCGGEAASLQDEEGAAPIAVLTTSSPRSVAE